MPGHDDGGRLAVTSVMPIGVVMAMASSEMNLTAQYCAHASRVNFDPPWACCRNAPAGVRTAISLASAETRISGGRSTSGDASPKTISTIPASRRRVCHSPSQASPTENRPSPQAGICGTSKVAAGSAAVVRATHRIASRPPAHRHQRQRLQMQRHQEQRDQPGRHHPHRGQRHGDHVRQHEVNLHVAEMIGAVRGGRRTGQGAGQRQRHDMRAQPPNQAFAMQAAQPRTQRLIAGDQRQHGGETHLERNVRHLIAARSASAPRPPAPVRAAKTAAGPPSARR